MYSRDFRHPSGQYQVRPIISNESFHYVLETSGMSRNPEYVKAVIRSYIEVKQARGRTGQQIGWKLELLERELPQHAHSFIAVRTEKRLPRSRILADINSSPRLSRASTHTPNTGPSLQEQYILSPNNRHPGRAASSASVRTTRTSNASVPFAAISSPARATSTYRPAPQATNPEDSEELPPPPYASEDPEPEATRDLQIRLAAEAQAAGNLNLPEAAQRRNENANENEGESDTGNRQANDNEGGYQQQGESDRVTPTNTSGSSEVTYAPPPDPPPTSSSLQRQESRRSEHHPSTPPTDPEEARIWEESQLEEALRLSKASERERLELEEAMRLSLAESEAETSNNHQNNDNTYNNPVFEGNEDHDSSGPSSRRISSYNPASQLEGNHRRAASDTYTRTPQLGVESATSGMEHLTIPDTWQSATGSVSQSNLMDDDFGSAEFTQPTLAPQRTGAVMQSKNPFLSPGETETPSQSSSFLQPQGSSNHENYSYAGSGGSPKEKRLPTIPGSEATSPTFYEPPSGPPPQFSPTPANPASNPSYLPPLPPRQPTLPIDGSPSSQANSSPQSRRLPPRPQQPPTLPQRNVSSSMYSASNPPTSSFPSHSPQPSTPSFFPPQSSPAPSPGQSADIQRVISTHHGGENPLETLRDFHTVFMVDDSSSMAGDRWVQARQALMGVAETAARYDEHGVDIYFINSKRVGKELRAAADVEELFAGLEPRGATPTGLRLEVILRDYMTRLERSQITSPGLEQGQRDHVKPLNLIVVTDGVFAHPIIARVRATSVNPSLDRGQLLGIAPVDDPESVIIACAKRLDKGDFPLSQVGIQFMQIGNDSDAREALQELDDNVAQTHGVRDMVDTVPFTGEGMTAELIVKTLLGGINRRLDRR